jgi:hypothetical protein
VKCDNSIYSNCIKNKLKGYDGLKGYDVLKKTILQTLKPRRTKNTSRRHDIRQHFSTNTGKRKKQQEKMKKFRMQVLEKEKQTRKNSKKRGLKIAKKD